MKLSRLKVEFIFKRKCIGNVKLSVRVYYHKKWFFRWEKSINTHTLYCKTDIIYISLGPGRNKKRNKRIKGKLSIIKKERDKNVVFLRALNSSASR